MTENICKPKVGQSTIPTFGKIIFSKTDHTRDWFTLELTGEKKNQAG